MIGVATHALTWADTLIGFMLGALVVGSCVMLIVSIAAARAVARGLNW
jgi:hypothetical protein